MDCVPVVSILANHLRTARLAVYAVSDPEYPAASILVKPAVAPLAF